jgi:hypothetical protein
MTYLNDKYEIRSWDGWILATYAPEKCLRIAKALVGIGVRRHYVVDTATRAVVWRA